MAGVSTKEIKTRIRSMESTKQITKAMEMVAASKLRHAQAQIAYSRPYFRMIYGVIQDIAETNTKQHLPYLEPVKNAKHRTAYVVIAGDRGLAGGMYWEYANDDRLGTERHTVYDCLVEGAPQNEQQGIGRIPFESAGTGHSPSCSGTLHDLAGRRLGSAPRAGLYVSDGHVVIQK